MRLVPVLQGEPIVLPVEGGFARKPAPCDGIYVDSDWPEFFAQADAQAAVSGLADKIKNRSAGRMARHFAEGKRR